MLNRLFVVCMALTVCMTLVAICCSWTHSADASPTCSSNPKVDEGVDGVVVGANENCGWAYSNCDGEVYEG